MSDLTQNEEVILLSIWRLEANAYGVTIRKNVMEINRKTLHYGSLYNTLDLLMRRGFIEVRESEPSATRGGRRKKLYTLTKQGKEALRKAQEFHRSAWEGISEFAFEGE